jgi:hypothetical protein
MQMSAQVRFGLVAVMCLAGCGGPGPYEVVLPRKVKASSGSPSVNKVTDLGDYGSVPGVGGKVTVGKQGDGVFTIGELILIEGSSFGKQPTVNIGGQPAERLARTGNGGIVTRIPVDVPTGKVEVEVSHSGGRGVRAIEIRRYGLVAQPGAGKVHVVSFGAKGAVKVHTALVLAGAKAAALSYDGQAAYVGIDAGAKAPYASLAVVAMGAKGGPRVVNKLRLAVKKVDYVITAHKAPLAAVIGEGKLTLVSLADPRNPALYDAWPLGEHATRIVAAQIAPAGGMLALLRGKGNQVVPIDVSEPRTPRAAAAVGLLPSARLPLVRGMGFSPDGNALWVLSGDNDESITAGEHTTTLTITKVKGTSITLDKTVPITGGQVPLALGVAPRESILGGTAIRSTARKVAIIMAGMDSKLLGLVGKPGLPRLDAYGDATELGQLVRTDLEGKGESLWAADGVVGALAISYDANRVVAAVTRIKRGTADVTYEFGLLTANVGGSKPVFTKLGAASASAGLFTPATVSLTP